MISQELFAKIQKANQNLTKWNQIMLNVGCFFMAILITVNAGVTIWLLVLAAVVVIANLQPKQAQKALKILMERTNEIEYIEIEKENGQIELDIKLKNDFKEYEIKLPVKLGEELIQELKAELPNVEFRTQKLFG